MQTDTIWSTEDFDQLRTEFAPIYAGRTVLITGADGFMGSHLTEDWSRSAPPSTRSCAPPRAAR